MPTNIFFTANKKPNVFIKAGFIVVFGGVFVRPIQSRRWLGSLRALMIESDHCLFPTLPSLCNERNKRVDECNGSHYLSRSRQRQRFIIGMERGWTHTEIRDVVLKICYYWANPNSFFFRLFFSISFHLLDYLTKLRSEMSTNIDGRINRKSAGAVSLGGESAEVLQLGTERKRHRQRKIRAE